MGLLAQTAEPAKEILGVERIAVVADKGYFKIEDIEACEEAGMDAYVPRPQRGPSVRAGLFRKDELRSDPASDSFLCPAGQRLHPYSSSLLRGLKKINYVNKQVCRDCPIRSQCTANRSASSHALRTKLFWTGCRLGSCGILTSLTNVARRSSTLAFENLALGEPHQNCILS